MRGFGLYVGCSCTIGNVAKGIWGSWIGILGKSCGCGMMVGLRMRIAMVDANGMCD
jgi:hypothetical protein